MNEKEIEVILRENHIARVNVCVKKECAKCQAEALSKAGYVRLEDVEIDEALFMTLSKEHGVGHSAKKTWERFLKNNIHCLLRVKGK